MEEFTKRNIGAKFVQHLQKKDNLQTHGGTSEASVEGTTHSIKNEDDLVHGFSSRQHTRTWT